MSDTEEKDELLRIIEVLIEYLLSLDVAETIVITGSVDMPSKESCSTLCHRRPPNGDHDTPSHDDICYHYQEIYRGD